ncbi:MAG: histidinol dehydrogenase [Gammaproteobacteria bacterium]|nr:histidinol dehydrogenase [Gammaproteobacteria bacterium]MCP5138733.1 histidinol dehydrogenase [Chromatiales bacterium]
MRIVDWTTLDEVARSLVLQRPAVQLSDSIRERVSEIVNRVRTEGDSALLGFAAELDGARLDSLRVDADEVKAAAAELSADARQAIATAIANVTRFHAAQDAAPIRVETVPGVVCERISKPLRAVGLYVPAGTAPLPSTAIMLAVPSGIAGCPVRVMCTPPRPDGRADPAVVTAAWACGIREIYKAGGAQAIAAMAYGTATVPKVVKIFGPGNAWVTAAKTLVAADPAGAALDMPAGPSEVMVIADRDANPRFVALDLLSQAEHGPDSHVVLVCTDRTLVSAVQAEIDRALPGLPRRDTIRTALTHAVAVIVPTLADAVIVANDYAPEHLILQTAEPRALAAGVDTAGSVFIGEWTPESVGDYCSGTNHVLPTYGYARAYSGLSVADFQRRMTLQEATLPGLRTLAPTVRTLAQLEGLDAHAQAVATRLEQTDSGRSP